MRDGASGAATSWAGLASYAIAALLAIILLPVATFSSWRLALLLVAALPLPVAAGALAALAMGEKDSLAAAVGLLGVLAIALRQVFRMIAAIRQRHAAHGGELTTELASLGAADGARPVLGAGEPLRGALVPLVIYGNRPGQEIEFPMAIVILGGLLTSALLNLFVLPALYLRFGRVSGRRPGR